MGEKNFEKRNSSNNIYYEYVGKFKNYYSGRIISHGNKFSYFIMNNDGNKYYSIKKLNSLQSAKNDFLRNLNILIYRGEDVV